MNEFRTLNRTRTTVLIAAIVLLVSACGQLDTKKSSDAAGPGCIDAKAVRSPDLYGDWQASFAASGSRPPLQASVSFTPHAQVDDALSGRIVRRPPQGEPQTSVLAGGAGDGQFGIEESADGKKITGLWNGDIVPGSCGREIRGIWTDALDDSERPFVLRRRGGAASQ